jgi:hypothetical protein
MVLVLVALLVSSGAAFARAKSHPSATISFDTGSVAAGIGFSWGSGTLSYAGKKYPFSVDGLSVGSVGITQASARGTVYNLHKVDDFWGTYTAVGAGATVGGGGKVSTMRNQNGVSINVTSTTRGVHLNISASGVKFSPK